MRKRVQVALGLAMFVAGCVIGYNADGVLGFAVGVALIMLSSKVDDVFWHLFGKREWERERRAESGRP